MQGKRDRVQQTEGGNQSHEGKKKDRAQTDQWKTLFLKSTGGQKEE